MSNKGPGPGRPKVNQAKKFSRRHVVNVTPELESAVQKFCDVAGFARMTDGMRALLMKALRTEGLL